MYGFQISCQIFLTRSSKYSYKAISIPNLNFFLLHETLFQWLLVFCTHIGPPLCQLELIKNLNNSSKRLSSQMCNWNYSLCYGSGLEMLSTFTKLKVMVLSLVATAAMTCIDLTDEIFLFLFMERRGQTFAIIQSETSAILEESSVISSMFH